LSKGKPSISLETQRESH